MGIAFSKGLLDSERMPYFVKFQELIKRILIIEFPHVISLQFSIQFELFSFSPSLLNDFRSLDLSRIYLIFIHPDIFNDLTFRAQELLLCQMQPVEQNSNLNFSLFRALTPKEIFGCDHHSWLLRVRVIFTHEASERGSFTIVPGTTHSIMFVFF